MQIFDCVEGRHPNPKLFKGQLSMGFPGGTNGEKTCLSVQETLRDVGSIPGL